MRSDQMSVVRHHGLTLMNESCICAGAHFCRIPSFVEPTEVIAHMNKVIEQQADPELAHLINDVMWWYAMRV